ncbi:hypothetical protein Hanom_Chr15g01398251 [Helianthus anomalus]
MEKKKSEAEKSNRKNDLCLHTGGSIGFDEHYANMTHATKECKKMVQDGEIDANDFDNLEFVTKHAKNSYSLHRKRKSGNLFGVGSSDPHFVVTGTPSSTTYVSYDDAKQPQEVSSFLLFFCVRNLSNLFQAYT